MDLGTNSFCLVVVDAHADGSFVTVLKEKEVLRLGDDVARCGRLSDERIDEAVASVRRLRTIALRAGTDEIHARATSAFREAENGADLVDRIEAKTGVAVDVISGRDEARLVFAAVRASVVLDPSPALCLDLGGGSLELMVGDAANLAWSASVRLGGARLTQSFLAGDPPAPDDVRRLRRRVARELGRLAREVAEFEPRTLVVSSGSLCDQVRMAAARAAMDGKAPTTVNQCRVTAAALREVRDEVLRTPLDRRRRLPGIDASRADLAPAASVVLDVAMETFGFDEVTGCDWSLREGIVLGAIRSHDPGDWQADARAIRRSSVRDLARRCRWDERHGTKVAALACDLFDQLLPLHGLRQADRELLEFAALLHDIGEHVAVDGHHKHSAYLIEHGRLRGFSPDEVHVLATLARFHRRGEVKTSYRPFGRMGETDRQRVTALAALLRVADGLDRGHTGVVDGVDVKIQFDAVVLRLHAAGDDELELWGVRRKRDLFARVFGRPLVLAADADADAAVDELGDPDDPGDEESSLAGDAVPPHLGLAAARGRR